MARCGLLATSPDDLVWPGRAEPCSTCTCTIVLYRESDGARVACVVVTFLTDSRCCRAIDDVLLIDLSRTEQDWLLQHTYPGALQLKAEHVSPDRIVYLDLEIRHDRGGFYTTMYDKRDALRLQGKMGAVRRFPHPSSVLSRQCKLACLTTFLHRAERVCMRRQQFVAVAAQRMVEMAIDGYAISALSHVAAKFARRYIKPPASREFVVARLRHTAARLQTEQRAAALLDSMAADRICETRRCTRADMTSRWRHLVCNLEDGGPWPDSMVYVGRRGDGRWDNRVSRPAARTTAAHQTAVDAYWQWLLEETDGQRCVEAARRELRGKPLGCHCSPLPCHGHALAVIANCSDEELAMLHGAQNARAWTVD